MRIRLKLMGVLRSKAPDGDALELPEGATIDDVLAALEIAPDSVQVYTVNGQLERDRSRQLAADDELSVLPPVGGG